MQHELKGNENRYDGRRDDDGPFPDLTDQSFRRSAPLLRIMMRLSQISFRHASIVPGVNQPLAIHPRRAIHHMRSMKPN